ncbi:MAG: tRNA dihydrouridine synthase DusB [Waddliaceae bacterium]|jgi:tRNA-dihydrouridine synthase B|nr:tRNA dihydrouridine synthase DusB [Waddliaceae bacterium]MBT3579354.1 tRNA dihydrouridine synthase DusB [Waddliaceae bacterium]MBT4444844.1 tRNA dihydrouridine synthase DusB [Waddliaceae bacterium]MBT6928020.1 tRNA dihydrouridine synthase DusB [Waddliaceae bacterium]MBT7264304.1 tRNA dihydrouridine synthase DusB [Waddliaceae bacterium]
MSGFSSPFCLRDLILRNNIIYAPMSGCSDFPFRRISREYHEGLIFCEMVKMEPLVRGHKGTLGYLDYSDDMHPIGAQLVGSNPAIAGESAKIIEDKGFDVIDLNCGCPVDKVIRDGSGSGMLKDPQRIGDIVEQMVSAVNIPVMVKIRAGWNNEGVNIEEITRIVEDAGAVAITIHGRTRSQGYSGSVNFEWVKACKAAAKNMLVIGNGDIFDGPSAKAMFDNTGCDGILVARGMLGNPWIAEDIERYMKGGDILEHSTEERRSALARHFSYMLEYKEERKALLEMRRVGCWYFKGLPRSSEFRGALMKAETKEAVWNLIKQSCADE